MVGTCTSNAISDAFAEPWQGPDWCACSPWQSRGMRHRVRPLHRLTAVVALVVVAGSLAACQPGDQEPPPDTGFEYAALGDSFTAAPDIPTINSDGCHRSDHNYPHLVAVQLEDVTLTDVSCGGARTDAVLASQVQQAQGLAHPPQIDAVSPTTDLITVGLGGNDLDFAFTAVFGCILAATFDPDGSPCEEANAGKVPRLLDRIEKRYLNTLDAIADRAPDARILVVGYPRLLEDSTGCPERFPIADGDVEFVRRNFDRLIETVEAVADEAGVEYVDVAAASEGHDICSDQPWINGKRVDARSGAAAYHPMPAEQAAVADLILDLL